MPQNQPPKDYMTAAEVKKMLGITTGMLYNFIDNGALERIIPPGRKQGVYRRRQVEQLARDFQIFISTREEDKTIFGRATREDIPELTEIANGTFSDIEEGIASAETRLKWVQKNPNIAYIVKHGEEIVGYTTIIPLKSEKIQNILAGKESMKDIKPEDIEDFQPGNPLHIYITMATKQGITKSEKRAYGTRLIGGVFTIFIEMTDRGIKIDSLYGRSETVDGIRILKGMGFTEISSNTNFKNFILRLNGLEIEIIQKYRQVLERRKEAN